MKAFAVLLVTTHIYSLVSTLDLESDSVLKSSRTTLDFYKRITSEMEKKIEISISKKMDTLPVSRVRDHYRTSIESWEINGLKMPRDVCFGNEFYETVIAKMKIFEIPMRNRINELKATLLEVESMIDVGTSIFKMRLESCKSCQMKGLRCEGEVLSQFQTFLYTLNCRLETNCSPHNASKRNEQSPFDYSKSLGDKFTCEDGLQEIPVSLVCDGSHDCPDGSDEHCPPTTNCTVDYGKFLCNNHIKCISLSDLCDGRDDCGDGSDEGGYCGESLCDPGCTAAGGVCLQTPRGFVCLGSCPPGTAETSEGCVPGRNQASFQELLDEVPDLLRRYFYATINYQKRVMQHIFMVGSTSSCRADFIKRSIRTILKLERFDKIPSNLPSSTPVTKAMEATTENQIKN